MWTFQLVMELSSQPIFSFRRQFITGNSQQQAAELGTYWEIGSFLYQEEEGKCYRNV
jgi:hypothetical protein